MEMEPDLTLAQSELSLTQSELTLTQGELALPQPDLTLALPAPHTPTYEMSEAEWGLSIMDRASEQDQDELSDDNQMQVAEVVDERTIPVNESIISLLLKLHSQLEGKVDSFALEDVPDTENMDGPYYIGCLLRELAGKEPRCADVINSLRHQLWGRQRQRQAELEAKERREKEERSRRARERQAAIMAEMARQQRQFLSSLGGAAESPPPSPGARSPRPARPAPEPDAALRPREYHCVICSSSDTPGHSDPLGPVVLLQSTSVPGHRRRAGSERAALPLSEAERTRLQADNERTAAALAYRAAQDLQQTFSQESCVTACGGGWALHAGVAAATCGHHLHLRCLLAYLRSLQATPHVERGEFLCPVCRQLANSVLPLAPECEVPTQLADPGLTLGELAAQLQALLDRAPDPPPETTPLSEAMGKSMEDMISTAGRGVRARHGSSPAALLAFVASLARTNLECELIQRGGDLLTHNHRYKPRNDCIVPLLEVIGVHARALRAAGGAATVSAYWRALTAGGGAGGGGAGAAGGGAGEEGGCSSVVPTCRQAAAVPLLLADPLSLFTHLILLAPQRPPHLDPSHFNCIVRVLYTLTYYQIVCQLLANTSAAGRAALAGDSANTGEGLRGAARTVLTALHDMQLWPDDDGVAPGPIADPENEVRELLLPFLRVVAVARAHILQQPLPEILRPEDEFANLLYYLELVPETPGVPVVSCAGLRSEVRPRAWVRQLATAAADSQLAVRRIVSSLHSAWRGPHLLRLPRSYERLFSHYHERVCGVCGAVPKEAAVCLLCGALLCLKQACCRRMQVCEAVQHSIECGGGTGIFLVVTSTYIIVIRGRRACLWGSLYLDDYDEEDRDLKRGKPLYLSQDRADLLEAQWLAHRFDHTKRTWVWHRDSL